MLLLTCTKRSLSESEVNATFLHGIVAALSPQKTVISSCMAHSFTYTMGVTALGVLAELTEKHSECVRGSAVSMYLFAKNFYRGE